MQRANSSRFGAGGDASGCTGPLQSSNPCLPPPQLPSHFPALQSGCQPGPFKDIPEGVVSVTSARDMNEQERVLTQLPLRSWGRRGRSCPWRAGGRASGQEQGTEAGVRIAEIAGNERRGMELRATGFCLALLWGCALAAAATQGKEGECLRGGRSQQGPRATGPRATGLRALKLHASLRDVPLETDLCLLGALGSVGLAGCGRGQSWGPTPGTPGFTELRDVDWGTQGSEAAENGMRRPPRGWSPPAASGTRPPQGARGPSEERRLLRGLFRAISFLVTLACLTHPP